MLRTHFARRDVLMVVAEAFGGLTALKTAMDMTKALKDINDAAIRNGAVIELQEKILSAREAQAALMSRIEDLEREIAAFKRWETEKSNYVLVEIFDNTFAYSLTETVRGAQPTHFVCASCFDVQKKSILQRVDAAHLRCPDCKTRIRFDQLSRPMRRGRYVVHRGVE
jgi:hypothetical protein